MNTILGKKLNLFLFCVLLAGKPAMAQVYEYEPAFIFTLFGDTIRCQLKFVQYITNKTEFRYKLALEDKKDILINAKDVLWIITPKDTFECLTIDKGLHKGEVYAYRLLVDGHLRLYAQERYIKMGGIASEVLYLKKEGMPLQEFDEFDYKKQLQNYTADDATSRGEIAALPYKLEEVKKFIKVYNENYPKK